MYELWVGGIGLCGGRVEVNLDLGRTQVKSATAGSPVPTKEVGSEVGSE